MLRFERTTIIVVAFLATTACSHRHTIGMQRSAVDAGLDWGGAVDASSPDSSSPPGDAMDSAGAAGAGGATGGTGGTTTTTGGDAAVGGSAGQTGGTGGTDAAGADGPAVQAQCSNPDEFAVKAIAVGTGYTCALSTMGGVRCWGDNEHGQLGDGTTRFRPNLPTTDGLTGVQAIAAGYDHTCALMTTGGVRCWGYNGYGQLGDGTTTDRSTPPTTDVLSSVQAIAVGIGHTCALTTTGGVRCWGSYSELGYGTWTNRLTPPTTDVLTDVQAISSGDRHTCALMTTGGVRCWGYNAYGQLGDGTTTDRMTPPTTDVLSGVQVIAAGEFRTCALMATGGVRCWGSDRKAPPSSDEISGVRAVAAGYDHICALMTTGGVRCWGGNWGGQLGDGTTTDRSTPPTTDVLSDVQAIAASGSHTCALLTTGGVRCWGNNIYGQLGDGTAGVRPTPPTSDTLIGVQALADAFGYTCALMMTGGVRCWGDNTYGQLGDGTTTARSTLPTTDVLTGVQAIAASDRHVCALMTAGGVRCWGGNPSGQLGDGTTTDRTSPPMSDVLTGAQAIATGLHFTCALMTTGGVRCWGDNAYGQLGDGTTTDRATPPEGDVLTGVQAIATGDRHTCALMTTGGVRCWGDNASGQLGDRSTTNRSSPPVSDVLTGVKAITADYFYTCALMTTGGVRCWGNNDHGQLGDGSTTDRAAPPDGDVLKGVQGLAVSYRTTCALMTTGGVRCWGYNNWGQLGDGTTRDRGTPPAGDVLTGVQAIVPGADHTCALMTTGGVRCWGINTNNQLGEGAPIFRESPVPVVGTCSDATPASKALTLVAGKVGGRGDTDGIGNAARFKNPAAVAIDKAGSLFVADDESHTIRQIDLATGAVTTLAGSAGMPGSTDDTGPAARFGSPRGMASDGLGNLFVADVTYSTVRKVVVATGAVTTLAGSPGPGGSTDGTGTAARFNSPNGLASDGMGNLFVADTLNHTIRKVVVATGAVTTLAGSAGNWGRTDGTGAEARFYAPEGVASDGAGNLFVADAYNQTIRKVEIATGVVTTLAGSPGIGGSTDGVGTAARFNYPTGIACDGAGNLFVADDGNHEIRRVVIATGAVATLAGSPDAGSFDGAGDAARFNNPMGVVSDGAGNLFVADFNNYAIRKVVIATRVVSTFAGAPKFLGSADGTGSAARFNCPLGVASDSEGNLFVADEANHTIRRVVLATGAVTTLAGVAGNRGATDGTGTAAQFNLPTGVALDGQGNLFVADSENHIIRKVVIATASVTTLAGSPGSHGSTDGVGSAARFYYPIGVATDGSGDLFVTDRNNDTIRRVVIATGEVTTLAGLAGHAGSADGTGTAARFDLLYGGVASDGLGHLFVADVGNNTIRKVTISTGEVTTLAGLAGSAGSADGTGTAARFNYPTSLALDKAGDLFIADGLSRTIRKVVVATQEVTTVVGSSGRQGVLLGPFPAGLSLPVGLAFGPSGELLIVDYFENSILAAWF